MMPQMRQDRFITRPMPLGSSICVYLLSMPCAVLLLVASCSGNGEVGKAKPRASAGVTPPTTLARNPLQSRHLDLCSEPALSHPFGSTGYCDAPSSDTLFRCGMPASVRCRRVPICDYELWKWESAEWRLLCSVSLDSILPASDTMASTEAWNELLQSGQDVLIGLLRRDGHCQALIQRQIHYSLVRSLTMQLHPGLICSLGGRDGTISPVPIAQATSEAKQRYQRFVEIKRRIELLTSGWGEDCP